MDSLASLCKAAIAKRLEKYPPQSLGLLPEAEWESIVEYKYHLTAPKHTLANTLGVNARPLSDGRMIPAISAEVMTKIEKANPHLSNSQITDELIWKDCVDYKFRHGGSTRPLLFRNTWPIWVQKCKNIGGELSALTIPPKIKDRTDDPLAQECNSRTDKLLHIIHVLGSIPMSKPLLEQSNIGKELNTFIKECHRVKKINHGKDELPLYFPWTFYNGYVFKVGRGTRGHVI